MIIKRRRAVLRWLSMVIDLSVQCAKKKAAKQMFTEEIFHDPNVRKFFREQFLGSKSQPSRAGYSVRPTERGLKKIDDTHPYYVHSLVTALIIAF